jgi:hypothetical protein
VDQGLVQLVTSVVGLLVGLVGLLTAFIQLKKTTREAQKDQLAQPKKRGVWKAVGYSALVLVLVAGASIAVSLWWQGKQPSNQAVSAPTKSATENAPPRATAAPARPEERPAETYTMDLGSHYGLGITHNQGSVYEYRAISGSISVKPIFGETVANCAKIWRSDRRGGQYIFTTCDYEKARIEVKRFD